MREIKLNHGRVTMVDDEDYEDLIKIKWNAGGFYLDYAICKWTPDFPYRFMHRYLLKVTDPKIFVDHIDHNGLNNQRSNIRLATPAQNAYNRFPGRGKKYKGVIKTKEGLYGTHICINKKTYVFAVFETEIEAAILYNELIPQYHGEFAVLNKIEDVYLRKYGLLT